MKKIIAMLMVLVMVLGLAACGGSSAPAASTTAPAASTTTTTTQAPAASTEPAKLLDSPLEFKISFTEGMATAHGQWVAWACDQVKEKTNGEVIITPYPDAQLGTNNEVLEQVLNGAPIIVAAGYDNLSSYVESCIPYAIPYVFETPEEVCKFGTSEFFDELAADITSTLNIRPIMSGSLGSRHFISTCKITCADDIKGHIIRMGQAQPCQEFVTVMGGTPATSAWADNYSMLQSKQIEACEAAIDLLWSSSLYEVCPYLCLSGHLSTPATYEISTTYWDMIPAEYQQVVLDAFNECALGMAEQQTAEAGAYVDKFKEAGTEVCENPDIASFTSYLPALFESLGIPTTKYDEIRAAIDAVM